MSPKQRQQQQQWNGLLVCAAAAIVVLVAVLQQGHAETSEVSSQPTQQRAHSMLVLQWPESVCASEKRACRGPIHSHPTMHGLWPIDRHKEYCRSEFDPRDLGSALEKNLTQAWPSYFGRSNRSFWKYEWKKHGSCLYDSAVEYFRNALGLYNRYARDLFAKLGPSATAHPLSHWTDLVQKRFGVQPMLMCQTRWLPGGARGKHKKSRNARFADGSIEIDADTASSSAARRELLLVEVGLCFTKENALVDCPVQGRIRRCTGRHVPREILLPPFGMFTGAK